MFFSGTSIIISNNITHPSLSTEKQNKTKNRHYLIARGSSQTGVIGGHETATGSSSKQELKLCSTIFVKYEEKR